MAAVSPEDRAVMGTAAEAAERLAAAVCEYRRLRQPVMADKAELRRREAAEHEARFQVCQASLLWLWHREDGAAELNAAALPDLVAALDALVTEIRAYQSPECDDEGAIGAAELKAADAALAKARG